MTTRKRTRGARPLGGRVRVGLIAAAVVLSALPMMRVTAQVPRSRADSLEQELRHLRARLDSLERVVARLTPPQRDTAQAVDELAALRAAAAAAAPDTATPRTREFVGRTRSQPQLNPEISATGDVRVTATRPGPQEDNFEVREFEFAVQSPLDPFANTKIFLTYEEGAVDLEEGYVYWTGLPGHLRLDFGRFRQQVGELNRWHLHALPESEYPLVLREFFGEEGLVGDGVSLYWLAPHTGAALGTHELWGQFTLANNEALFNDGHRLALTGHFLNFWELGSAAYFQIGASAVYGKNPDEDLETTAFGGDLRFTWRPPQQAQYRSFTLRAEGYAVTKRVAGIAETRYGGFAGAEYQLSRRLFGGARFDYVEPLAGGDAVWAVAPHLTWWQSEWVYLRAEWQHESIPAGAGRANSDRFLIQAVWAVGPHKHENY
jgi:hypothetical protein